MPSIKKICSDAINHIPSMAYNYQKLELTNT